MPRSDHHCPERNGTVGNGPNATSAGGCRGERSPIPHCAKHQKYCIPHNRAYMKFKVCPSCEGVRSAKHKNNNGYMKIVVAIMTGWVRIRNKIVIVRIMENGVDIARNRIMAATETVARRRKLVAKSWKPKQLCYFFGNLTSLTFKQRRHKECQYRSW